METTEPDLEIGMGRNNIPGLNQIANRVYVQGNMILQTGNQNISLCGHRGDSAVMLTLLMLGYGVWVNIIWTLVRRQWHTQSSSVNTDEIPGCTLMSSPSTTPSPLQDNSTIPTCPASPPSPPSPPSPSIISSTTTDSELIIDAMISSIISTTVPTTPPPTPIPTTEATPTSHPERTSQATQPHIWRCPHLAQLSHRALSVHQNRNAHPLPGISRLKLRHAVADQISKGDLAGRAATRVVTIAKIHSRVIMRRVHVHYQERETEEDKGGFVVG